MIRDQKTHVSLVRQLDESLTAHASWVADPKNAAALETVFEILDGKTPPLCPEHRAAMDEIVRGFAQIGLRSAFVAVFERGEKR